LLAPHCSVPLAGRIIDVDYLGALARYEVELAGGQRLRALSSLHQKAMTLGETVGVSIDRSIAGSSSRAYIPRNRDEDLTHGAIRL